MTERSKEQRLFRSPLMATRTRSIYVGRTARNFARRSAHLLTMLVGQRQVAAGASQEPAQAGSEVPRLGNGHASEATRSASAAGFLATSSRNTRQVTKRSVTLGRVSFSIRGVTVPQSPVLISPCCRARLHLLASWFQDVGRRVRAAPPRMSDMR